MPSLALLCETVDSLQCTAASIQAAIEAVRGNAAAAIHVAEAAAKDASAKLDPLTLASETRSALEAVRTVETRKIAALEAELVMLDEVLESILRAKEIGVWESLSPEAAVRLHELIVTAWRALWSLRASLRPALLSSRRDPRPRYREPSLCTRL